ncbi:glycoside hydrolase family 5 protein [uncultured Sphingomonas sp.]|uniref:glycoside hydrolase family 5 protein n=1 Tax=uncultured Sphingomonas sp. TaxID=158754 RepID=UPI0035CC202B
MARGLSVAMRALAVAAVALLLAGPRGPMLSAADNDAQIPVRRLAMTGVNLAGGEFGGEGRPLVVNRDYVYPDGAAAAPFLAAGMNIARVPIRWENIQRAPLALLDPEEMAHVDAALAALAGFRWIVLDIHNYARFQGVRLTDDDRSAAMLANLWGQLARRCRGNPRLVFGLMNEPVDVSAAAWRRIAEASVLAIRRTGARNLILVPGTNWSGAHSWTTGGAQSNAAAMAGFRDPGNRFAFELHQYLDRDSSGTNPECVGRKEAVDRLRAATAWLEAQGARGFLGEFGSGPGRDCLDSLEGMLDHLERHSRAWIGWTAWAGGAWWGDNPFSLQPDGGGRSKPQLLVLRRHVRTDATKTGLIRDRDTGPNATGQPADAGG